MIGIVVPAHNEEEHLPGCVAALRRAASHPALDGETVRMLVVLDHCTDGSRALCRQLAVPHLRVWARRVGVARHVGASRLIAQGARWIAFTDADTVVADDWLVSQLAQDADAVCGTVAVNDWSAHGDQADAVREAFAARYTDAEGHRHVHGANLGVSAECYRRSGGCPPVSASEDVALVQALIACGARIAWSAAPRVLTSARKRARASGGFADTLLQWAQA